MTPLRAGRGAALFLAALLAGCGPDPSAPSTPAASEAPVADLAPLLGGTWFAAAVANPDAVSGLIDGPGGEGWLALFENDLDRAKRAFASNAPAEGTPAPAVWSLGMARVHLAQADVLMAARSLEEQATLDGIRYRAERQDRLRPGAWEPLLAALSLASLPGADPVARDAAVARARESAPATPEGKALRALLDARLAGDDAVPEGLPEALAAQLTAPDPQAPGPHVVDSLGEDADAGLRFEAKWWDPVVQRARLQHHLEQLALHARRAGVAPLVAIATDAAPDRAALAARLAEVPAGEPPVPPELSLFVSPWVDAEHLRAAWGLDGGRSLLSRVAATEPQARIDDGWTSADADRLLRYEAAFEARAADALETLATSGDGTSLIRGLQLPRKLADALLRDRIADVAGESPVVALRIAERSLDVGGASGAKDGSRLSHRNDAGFLVRLAEIHALGGRPGVARDYVHPLVARFPGLAAASHQLGQLDAASSIGVQGKTSQQ